MLPGPRGGLLDVVGALAGAGREAVVQRVAQRAHGVRPGPAGEAGGGRRLVGLAHVLPAAAAAALPRVSAVVELVQGLQGEVQGPGLSPGT